MFCQVSVEKLFLMYLLQINGTKMWCGIVLLKMDAGLCFKISQRHSQLESCHFNFGICDLCQMFRMCDLLLPVTKRRNLFNKAGFVLTL